MYRRQLQKIAKPAVTYISQIVDISKTDAATM